jgi:hypothetical protein
VQRGRPGSQRTHAASCLEPEINGEMVRQDMAIDHGASGL